MRQSLLRTYINSKTHAQSVVVVTAMFSLRNLTSVVIVLFLTTSLTTIYAFTTSSPSIQLYPYTKKKSLISKNNYIFSSSITVSSSSRVIPTVVSVLKAKDDNMSPEERAIAMDKALKAMTAFSNKYVENTGTYYCADKSIPAVVIKGLAEHKVTLGTPLCPCRFYEDKEKEAQDGYWNW